MLGKAALWQGIAVVAGPDPIPIAARQGRLSGGVHGFHREPHLTVVCFKNGVLAADRRVTYSYDLICGDRTKIFCTDNGNGYGFSGNMSESVLFAEWVAAGCPTASRPELSDYQAIRIEPGGIVALASGKYPAFATLTASFYAIGSGRELAMGAMWQGATAEEAVECAIALCSSCGGGVEVLRLYEQASEFRPRPVVGGPYDSLHSSHFGGPR